MAEYTEGICADGAAILQDGSPMGISDILAGLTLQADLLAAAKAFVEPYAEIANSILELAAGGESRPIPRSMPSTLA